MKITTFLKQNINLLLMITILVLVVIIFRKTMREGLTPEIKPKRFIREVCDADCELGCSIRGKCENRYKNLAKKNMHYINEKGNERILKYSKKNKSWENCDTSKCKKRLKKLIINSCCGSFDGNLSHGIRPKKSPSEEIAENETKMYPDGDGGDWEGVPQCADKMRTTKERQEAGNKYAEVFEYDMWDPKRLANCSQGSGCQNLYTKLGKKYRFSRPDVNDNSKTKIFKQKDGKWVECRSVDCVKLRAKGIGRFCCDSLGDLASKGKAEATDYYGIEDNLPETKGKYELPLEGEMMYPYGVFDEETYKNVDIGSKCPKNIPLKFYNDFEDI